MRSMAVLVSTITLVHLVRGELAFVREEDAASVSLQQYGAGQSSIDLLLTTKMKGEFVIHYSVSVVNEDEKAPVCTNHSISVTQISEKFHNVTAELYFDAWVGDFMYEVTVITKSPDGQEHPYIISGTHSVYGIVIYEMDIITGKRTLVSGDEAPPVEFASYKNALGAPRELRTFLHSDHEIDIRRLKVSVHDAVGSQYSDLLEPNGVSVTNKSILISPNKYRVGSGLAIVNLELSELSVDGESFETQFIVAMGSRPAPPPVISNEEVVIASMLTEGGVTFTLKMYNVGNIKDLSASVSDGEFLGEIEAAESMAAEQTVTFRSETRVLAGTFIPRVYGRAENGTVIEAKLLHSTRVRVLTTLGGEVALKGVKRPFSVQTMGIVGGLVGLALLLTVAVVAFIAARSRRQSEASDASYDSESA